MLWAGKRKMKKKVYRSRAATYARCDDPNASRCQVDVQSMWVKYKSVVKRHLALNFTTHFKNLSAKSFFFSVSLRNSHSVIFKTTKLLRLMKNVTKVSLVGTPKECVAIVRDESHLTFNTSEQIFVHDGKFFRMTQVQSLLTLRMRTTKKHRLDVDTKSWPLCLEPSPEQFISLFTVLRRHAKWAEESHELTQFITKSDHSTSKIFFGNILRKTVGLWRANEA